MRDGNLKARKAAVTLVIALLAHSAAAATLDYWLALQDDGAISNVSRSDPSVSTNFYSGGGGGMDFRAGHCLENGRRCIFVGVGGTLLRYEINATGGSFIDETGQVTTADLFGIDCTGDYCALVGDNVIFDSLDKGRTWEAADLGENGVALDVMNDVACWGSGTCLAVGANSVAFKRRSNSKGWGNGFEIDPNDQDDVFAVEYFKDGNTEIVMAVGDQGYMHTSDDEGATWNNVEIAGLNELYALDIYKDSGSPEGWSALMMGDGGDGAYTNDGGATATLLTIPPNTDNIWDVHCTTDATLCVAAGGQTGGGAPTNRGRFYTNTDLDLLFTQVTAANPNNVFYSLVNTYSYTPPAETSTAMETNLGGNKLTPGQKAGAIVGGIFGGCLLIAVVGVGSWFVATRAASTTSARSQRDDEVDEADLKSVGPPSTKPAVPADDKPRTMSAITYNRGGSNNEGVVRPPPRRPETSFSNMSSAPLVAGGDDSDSESVEKVTAEEFEAEPLPDIEDDGWTVPPIVNACVEWMLEKGLDTEGVFRIPGNHTLMNQWLAEFNAGGEVDMNEIYDANDVAGLLKLWTKQQPDFIVPQPLYKKITMANDMTDSKPEAKLEAMRTCVDAIPGERRDFLVLVVKLFVAISDNWKVNKMKVNNMAMVYAPTLFKKMSIGNANSILAYWIRNYDELFTIG